MEEKSNNNNRDEGIPMKVENNQDPKANAYIIEGAGFKVTIVCSLASRQFEDFLTNRDWESCNEEFNEEVGKLL